MGNWVNTVVDSDGISSIGTEAESGVASLGDRESKRVVTKFQDMPAKAGITAASEAKKDQPQGR
jgi:hypothetical protein